MTANKVTSTVNHVAIPQERAGQRLDNFLMARLKGVPRSVIYRIIRTGQVRINGRRAKPASRLESGDMVRIPPASIRVDGPTDIPQSVLQLLARAICFEAQGVMVINKPAGMAVHRGSGLAWGVVDAVRKLRPDHKVDLVHRLDRETSGCMLLALSGDALRALNQQILKNQVEKHYLCLLDGHLQQSVVEVEQPIARAERAGERFMRVDPLGKPAHTTFRKLQHYGPCTLVEAELHSGRTHQIRVHANHLDMPLVGDKRYAPAARQKLWKSKGARRLFLHAHRLQFFTLNGEQQLVSSQLPSDLKALLNELE